MNKILLVVLMSVVSFSWLYGQEDYKTLDEIADHLRDLGEMQPDFVTLESLTKSPGDNDIWLLRVGTGDEELKPGFLLLASVDGTHPAGTHTVLGITEKILREEGSEGTRLMDRFYFYVVPVLNPDAYEQYHADLQFERTVNARETDIDRDGRISEDPYNDLDGDGKITFVRIEDPTGDYISHREDDRVMIPFEERPADGTIYRMISEGIDNDKDGQFNEDGPGGVNLNMNFSFDYPAFQPGAGEHAVSEEENRMLAEFLFERWNIYAVFTFAKENNLSHPVSFDRQKVSQRVITGPLERDAEIAARISKLFKEQIQTGDAPVMQQGPGSFSSWAYFHYCRFSFVNPGWWAPKVDIDSGDGEGENDKPNKSDENYDLRFIQWAESEGIEDFFVPWTAYDHPDFPGRQAEVGGFKPFVRYNPPPDYLEEVVEQQFQFLSAFSSKMPRLEIQDVRVDALENRVFRVRGKVVNTGQLPTSTSLGDRTRWVRDIRARILLEDDQELMVGHYRDFHKSLMPGEYFEFSWLISGRGSVVIEAAHPMTLDDAVNLELR